MVHRCSIKKIKWLARVFLLCVGALCVCGAFPAHAQESVGEGTWGSCIWKYETVSMEGQDQVSYRLTISPTPENDLGVLKNWEENAPSLPPWQASSCSDYRSRTIYIKIAKANADKKLVKALTCVNMFKDFAALIMADLSGLDVASVANMSSMFSGCHALDSIISEGFDTSSATTMSRMFQDCETLFDLHNTAGWNTSNVIDMSYMFCGCSSLAVLDLRGWSTSGNPNMMGMFDTYGPSGKSHSQKSLACLHVGEKFHFGEFSDSHSSDVPRSPLNDTCFRWLQVGYNLGGSSMIPKGRTFASFDQVVAFHNNREKGFDLETYVQPGFYESLLPRDKGTVIGFSVQGLSVQVLGPVGASDREGSTMQGSSMEALESLGGPGTEGSTIQGSSVEALESLGGSTTEGSTIQGSSVEALESLSGSTTEGSTMQGSSADTSRSTDELCIEEPSIRAEQSQDELAGWHEYDNMVFYYRDGEKLTGWQELTGTIQDPSSLPKSWFYFNDDGVMFKGQHELVGGFNGRMNWFYFNEVTGAELRGWKYIDYQDKWCYYSRDDGTMLKGQHELQGGDNGGMNWFYFDEVTGAELRNCWKEIPSQGKTCYYGSDGAMYKGWHEIDGKRYYFDEVTGALT